MMPRGVRRRQIGAACRRAMFGVVPTGRTSTLFGTADTTIPIGAQQATGQRLADAGKAVESRYYEGWHHVLIEDQLFKG